MVAGPDSPAVPAQMTRARSLTTCRGNCTNTVSTALVGNGCGHSTRIPPSEMSITVPPSILFSVPKRTGRLRA